MWTSSKHSASRSPHRCPPGRSGCGVRTSPRSRCSRSAASCSRCGRSASTSMPSADRSSGRPGGRACAISRKAASSRSSCDVGQHATSLSSCASSSTRGSSSASPPSAQHTWSSTPSQMTARTTASADWLSSSPSGRSRCGRRSASTFAISDPAGTDSLPASTARSTPLCRDSRRAVATVSASDRGVLRPQPRRHRRRLDERGQLPRLGVTDPPQQHPAQDPLRLQQPVQVRHRLSPGQRGRVQRHLPRQQVEQLGDRRGHRRLEHPAAACHDRTLRPTTDRTGRREALWDSGSGCG